MPGMYTLYITRHAKSSWASPGQDDFNRPLNERGLRDAQLMAQKFAERSEPVPILVSSTANRAITTARAFAKALGNVPIKEQPSIYHATLEMLMAVVESLPANAKSVMLFGHNPGLSELVEHLTGGNLGTISPCTTVRIDLEVGSWPEVAAGTGSIAWWQAPERP